MYQAVQAVWKEGNVVPLESFVVEENTPLMVVVLRPFTPPATVDSEQTRRVASIRAVQGKYRDSLSSVDEFIAHKQEEIALEEGCARNINP